MPISRRLATQKNNKYALAQYVSVAKISCCTFLHLQFSTKIFGYVLCGTCDGAHAK